MLIDMFISEDQREASPCQLHWVQPSWSGAEGGSGVVYQSVGAVPFFFHLGKNRIVVNRDGIVVWKLIVLEGFKEWGRRQALCSLKNHSFIKHLLSVYSKVGIEERSGDTKINNKPIFLQRLKIVKGGSQGNKYVLYTRGTALFNGGRNILWIN